jgi:hypothetical protein
MHVRANKFREVEGGGTTWYASRTEAVGLGRVVPSSSTDLRFASLTFPISEFFLVIRVVYTFQNAATHPSTAKAQNSQALLAVDKNCWTGPSHVQIGVLLKVAGRRNGCERARALEWNIDEESGSARPA